MPVAFGYALMLAVVLLVAAGALLYHAATRPDSNPLHRYAPCVEVVLAQEWYCSNGRAYVRQGGAWADAGLLTFVPPIPRA